MKIKIKKKPEDQVIRYLLDKRKNPMEKVVWFGASDFTKLKDIQPDEILEALNKLQANEYISCSQVGQKQDYSIRLLNKADTYFDVQEDEKHEKFREQYRFWIPTGLSILAIIVAFADHFGWWV